ncbi:coil containing protein [Vibrio phage 1.144.O._10N.286.45.B3]|nr:coil containing protein [Vibrio phage 1.144.O._10N.286.45.B3]
MSNLKTSDIWPDGYKLTFDYCPSNTSSHETFGFIFSSSEPCIFICDVVNNHDRLQQENVELREALHSIKDKLNDATSINEIEAFIYMICDASLNEND